MKPIQIGLIGFGTVGTGVARLLTEQRDLLARRLGSPLILKKVADLDLDRPRPVALPADSSPPGPQTSWTTRKSISWWNSSAAPLPPGTM